MLILTVIVAVFGIGLLLTGAYFHLNRKTLQSDPVLISACYLWGGINIAACML